MFMADYGWGMWLCMSRSIIKTITDFAILIWWLNASSRLGKSC